MRQQIMAGDDNKASTVRKQRGFYKTLKKLACSGFSRLERYRQVNRSKR